MPLGSDSNRLLLEVSQHQTRPQCILVVDDKPDNLLLMRELLTQHGYRLITTTDPEEVIELVHQERPDLILLDVIMPGRSGYEICHELKSDPMTRFIPVVMITGLSDRNDRVKGIEAGADDFLSKPIYPEELFARVKSLLKLKDYVDEMENAEGVLFTLALGVEARDPYTGGHCERLATFASQLGEHLGLDAEKRTALYRGGYLHDLGKISIPDEILKKGSHLTGDEWLIMRQHPIIGENICRPLKSFREVLPIIRHHHEHWDGSGYPDGLKGEEIPLLARILQTVDVYDALRTARPYKPSQSHEQTEATMLRESEQGLWDGEMVREFFAMLQEQRAAA